MPHRAIILTEETWISARALAAWLDAGNEVAEIWCGPGSSLERPVRQPMAMMFPGWSVRQIVRRRRLEVRRCPPLSRWPTAIDAARAAGADVLLNIFGMQIIPRPLIDHFGGRAVNLHPALLPLYRGPCPRIAMIADGRADEAGGVCVHVLTSGVDEGPIIAERAVPFSAAGDYADWDAELAVASSGLIAGETVEYLEGRRDPRPQDESIAFYRRPRPGEIDIGAATTLAQARRLVSTLGPIGHLQCRPPDGTSSRRGYRVTDIVRVIGPPGRGSARIGPRHIELDIADARVVLARRGVADRVRAQVRAFRALRRHADRRA